MGRIRLVGLAGVLAACAPADPPAEPMVLAASQPIAGGYEDPDDDAVVGLLHLSTGTSCTGTLIAPNVVLTARHCVSRTLDGDSGVSCEQTYFGSPYDGAGFWVTTADELTVGTAGEFFGALTVPLSGLEGIPAHVDEDTPFCGHDVAIVILDGNIPREIAVPYEPALEAPVSAGIVYSAIGYGGEDNEGTGSGLRRRRDELEVTCVGLDCAGDEVIVEGQITPDEWVGNGGVCRGDSGGPALDADHRLIGVTSRGTEGCDLSLYGAVYPLAQWLKNTVTYASGLGGYDAPPWTAGATVDPEHSMPVGEACSAANECPSGKCLGPEGGKYCSRACSAEAACPEGYDCEGQVCVALEPTFVSYERPDSDGCRTSSGDAPDPSWLTWGLLAFWAGRRRARAV